MRSNHSFMKSLFFGQIREDLVFPFPRASQSELETVDLINGTIEKFSQEISKKGIDPREWDRNSSMPKELVSQLAELGLMGLAVPEEFGGIGLSQSAYVRVMQEVGRIDASLGITMGAHQSIGYKALLLFGTKEQKERFLPRLASGELIAAYCLTETESGSDAASIRTTARLSSDGSHYVISGSKLWITNGEIANFLTVFAKTEVDGKEKVSCFVVERPTDGIKVGPSEHKLGIRASWTNAIYFDEVKVPVENLVGGVGKGFKVAMGVLNHGRSGIASGCVGFAKNCIEASIAHANERVQFGKKLIEFGLIQEKIARVVTRLYVAEAMVYMTTSLLDHGGIDYSLESAISKIFASEMVWEAADENVQIWGGAGYMTEFPHEQWLRDVRIIRIFEGSNEVLRAFVALSGMQGPGQQLAGLAEAIKYPLKGLGQVTDFAYKRIKRSIIGESITMAHPLLKRMTGVTEDYASELASKTEALLRRHGKKIHLKQFAQKRIADIAIDLYAMVCLISRVTGKIESIESGGGDPSKYELELAIAETFFQGANRRIRSNFSAIDHNEDHAMKEIARAVSESGKIPFDGIRG